MDWKELQKAYEKELKTYKSENTYKSYMADMRQWDFKDKPTKAAVDEKIIEWKEKVSSNTIYHRGSALRFMLTRFSEEFETTECKKMIDTLSDLPTEYNEMTAASQVEAEDIIADCDPRLALVIGLMYYAGLRICEVTSLDMQDMKDGIRVRSRKAKSKTERIIPIVPKLQKLIDKYVKIARPEYAANKFFKPTDRLIVSRKGATSEKYLQNLVKKACVAAGCPDLSCHPFRHGTGTQLARSGVNVIGIATILGHHNLTVTKRYINYDKNDLAGMMKGL